MIGKSYLESKYIYFVSEIFHFKFDISGDYVYEYLLPFPCSNDIMINFQKLRILNITDDTMKLENVEKSNIAKILHVLAGGGFHDPITLTKVGVNSNGTINCETKFASKHGGTSRYYLHIQTLV